MAASDARAYAQSDSQTPSPSQEATTTPSTEPAPFAASTPICRAPEADIASPAPLPNLARALAERRHITVLAIGSSSTFGIGASTLANGYPAQFGAILEDALRGVDAKIINRGVSGELAASAAERMRSEIAIEKPDLVLWQLGTNDALARVPISDFARTVRAAIEWLKGEGIDVALVGLQYTPRFARDEHYLAVHDILRGIAESESTLYIRRYNVMQFLAKMNRGGMLSQDGLHLNDLGYRCMAEHIAQAVIANLYPPTKPLSARVPQRH